MQRDAGAAPLLVIMGVSGCGKTTVGAALSQRLGLPFADADDFHSPANIAKMSAGIPLDDRDRLPWLAALGGWLAQRQPTGGLLSCSALKRTYRDALRASCPTLTFIHLDPPADVVRRRMAGRLGHFMPASLIDSQFQSLERLHSDEHGIVLDLDRPAADLMTECLTALPQFADLAHRQDPNGVPQRPTTLKG